MLPSPQVPTSKNSIASTEREYLTSILPELLVRVLSEVPLSSYFDVAHTSKGLRSFLEANAAMTCNMAIRSRFPIVAKILEVTKTARNEEVDNKEA
jgi:hypothetical protein